MDAGSFYRLTELDRTTWPEVRDQILSFSHGEPLGEPRSYPGYPIWPLVRCRPRLWPSLERTLWTRRTALALSSTLPTRPHVSRLLQFSHGISASRGRGPIPSAGGLQALELYLVNFGSGWLPSGLFHYERGSHALAQLAAGAERLHWAEIIPSLQLLEGGALLWVLVGDGARAAKKYGPRGQRLLLLEAGHLMQNLCLMSHRLGLTTVPLGAFFEEDIAREFALPAGDAVLYVGVCGTPTLAMATGSREWPST